MKNITKAKKTEAVMLETDDGVMLQKTKAAILETDDGVLLQNTKEVILETDNALILQKTKTVMVEVQQEANDQGYQAQPEQVMLVQTQNIVLQEAPKPQPKPQIKYVFVNQPTLTQTRQKEYNSGRYKYDIYNCCAEKKRWKCFQTFFIPCGGACVHANAIEKATNGKTSCIYIYCLDCVFPIYCCSCTSCLSRKILRAQYNIQGNACGDLLAMQCLSPCAIMQDVNEVEYQSSSQDLENNDSSTFKYDLFDCCAENQKLKCFLVFFLPCADAYFHGIAVQEATNQKTHLSLSICLDTCLNIICRFPTCTFTKKLIRDEYNIEGNTLQDCLAMTFCRPCSIMQDINEVQYQKY